MLTKYLLGYNIDFVSYSCLFNLGGKIHMTIAILSFIIIGYFIFRRNIPIIGVPQINKKDIELSMLNVVDIRDYNVSYKSPIQGAINIPVLI